MSSWAPADKVSTVAVIGAGTMGHGIAQVCAMAQLQVRMYDLDEAVLAAGVEHIRGNLERGVARGKVKPDAQAMALAAITTTTWLSEAVEEADVVIEAAPERIQVKQSLFSQFDAASPPHALLATNTSSLSIADISAVVAQPERVIGMHFFNPVHIMKLLEIVYHEQSTDVAIAVARELGQRIGKTPIVVKDVAGFASSRLGVAIGLEAMRMVEDGVALPADIDTATKLGYGFPMGPLELSDLVGLDVRLHIADYLAESLGERFRAPDILRRMVAAGQHGRKTGTGFYRWQDGKRVS